MPLVELSHPIEDGMPGYPGLPRPAIVPHLSHEESRAHYAAGTEFTITRLELVGNTATYLDSPFHRYRDGRDISELPLEALVGLPAVVLDGRVGPDRSTVVDAGSHDLRGRAVLVRTGWDRRWGRPDYWEPGPHLDLRTAEALVRAGAVLVGTDSWNVDDTARRDRPVHSTLLAAGVLVVEHLCHLDRVPEDGARFSAVPLAVAGAGTLPVRAWAEFPGDSS
ncbi:MAG TPA: cyclase family protein [Jiangellales bacterium]|nr:cyclase family protein [Jiangellales bacterium]